ncbi:MAG: MFS transporter [Deltaproteobacteria bacterium HGW-Deltaproteobacteria-8]|jgi:MFS family permease|nr:MAG: MFS transporter [Deltaproteobacteria bacterium HGW-Deltaproteobacteria-8]
MLLAYCNISIFYSLYPYLEDLGIAQQWRGLIISSSALATILCFLFVTPRLSERTAPRAVFAGIGLLIACGLAYLFVRHTLGLLVLRLFNGTGIALLTASAMTLLVGEIPPERSGQAFGFYSVAMLLPYSIVPALFDHVGGLLPGPEYGYALMSLALVPAALVNLALLRHGRGRVAAKTPQAVADGGQGVGFAAMLASARRPATGLLLLLNSVYYLNFSALFFLSKSLFASRDLGGVGLFFSIQTGLMLATRLAATRLFDEVSKPLLILWCYALTGLGFAMLWTTHSQAMVVATALVLGLGMGVGPPSLNALMFGLSEQRLKAVNSNLMVMALQAGSFLGPILGGVAVGILGYSGFLAVGLAANLGGIWLSLLFQRRGWTGAIS